MGKMKTVTPLVREYLTVVVNYGRLEPADLNRRGFVRAAAFCREKGWTKKGVITSLGREEQVRLTDTTTHSAKEDGA